MFSHQLLRCNKGGHVYCPDQDFKTSVLVVWFRAYFIPVNLPLDHRAATNLSYMFAELYQKVVVFGLPRYDKSIRSG